MASPRATGVYMRPAFGLLLEKLAYGPEDVTKVLQATRALVKSYPEGAPELAGGVAAAMNPERRVASAVRRAADTADALGPAGALKPQMHAQLQSYEMMKALGLADDAPAGRPRIALLRGPRGHRYSEVRALEKDHWDTALDDKNRRAAASIVRGHEYDELGASGRAPSFVTMDTGHMSPLVMFREHNRVATLPEELAGARDLLKATRATNEDPLIFRRLGLEYGSSPRLSRHAIKRLTESLDRKGVRLGYSHKAPAGATPEQIIAANDAEVQRLQTPRKRRGSKKQSP